MSGAKFVEIDRKMDCHGAMGRRTSGPVAIMSKLGWKSGEVVCLLPATSGRPAGH